MLSKSKYTRGMNCNKSLWLYVHKKDEQVIDATTQAIFTQGTNVGQLAQAYFPNGKMAVLEDYPRYQSAKRTQELIDQGVETIYEATFIYDDTLVAIDLLHKENERWHLYEVKSTNDTKPEHIKDVAVQYYVAVGAGLDLSNASVMHFDRDYVRHGDIEVQKLFKHGSVLKHILPLQENIGSDLKKLKEMLKADEPVVEMGTHCHSPYSCDFAEYCKKLLPPVESEETAALSNEPEIQVQQIRNFVSRLKYPLCHLDFETLQPGVPMFDESSPYQQIAFQYSIHIQVEKGGPIMHREYLAENNPDIDPRIGLIQQMIKDTKSAATILTYNQGFEGSIIRQMKVNFPMYAQQLQSILDRMDDLMIPFRSKHYKTESMEGRWSIKIVLPTLCPELSYKDLDIGDGMAARNAFVELYHCSDPDTIAKTRENLLKYCGLDTWAMVKVLEVLEGV